jgi:hypothetical protein
MAYCFEEWLLPGLDIPIRNPAVANNSVGWNQGSRKKSQAETLNSK